jgi:hypothetical protein
MVKGLSGLFWLWGNFGLRWLFEGGGRKEMYVASGGTVLLRKVPDLRRPRPSLANSARLVPGERAGS